MRKSIYLTIALAIVTTSIFALDVSYETGRDQSIKKDKSMSVKKGSEKKNSNRNFNSKIKATSSSVGATFDAVAVYTQYADECIRSLTPAADFGLDIEEDGIINLNKKAYFDNASAGAMKLSEVGGIDEMGIKKYMGCIIYNSARMAQANLDLQNLLSGKTVSSSQVFEMSKIAWKNSSHPKNIFVVSQLSKASQALNAPCRFVPNMGKDSIQCGSLIFSFVDNSIKSAGELLSPGDKFFGINSSFRVSVSDTINDGSELSNENSSSSSRDASLAQTYSNSMNRGGKQTTNVSPFIPK